jgi:hypothetical protein
MKVVYVAGPITAYNSKGQWDCWTSENYVRQAEEVALRLWLAGIAAICPHTMGRFWNGVEGASHEMWLAGDKEIIRRCDAIVVCPGWKKSVGTNEEIAYALSHGIPVFYSAQNCIAWSNDRGAKYKA